MSSRPNVFSIETWSRAWFIDLGRFIANRTLNVDLKFVLIQSTPVLLTNLDTLSKAPQLALLDTPLMNNVARFLQNPVEVCIHLIASEQELFGAAAEKSDVTILPKASQGELNSKDKQEEKQNMT